MELLLVFGYLDMKEIYTDLEKYFNVRGKKYILIIKWKLKLLFYNKLKGFLLHGLIYLS